MGLRCHYGMLINKKKEKNNMGLVNQEKQYSKKQELVY